MTVSKIRLPDNTEHDIRAKYLIQSTSSDATSAEFSARTVTEDAIANIQKIYGNTVVVSNNLVSNSATAILSRGFNQWDEGWESGAYDNGIKITDNSCIRSKNYIGVLPNTTYYIKFPAVGRVSYYNAAKTFLTSNTGYNTTKTTPNDCYYITFHVSSTTKYANDICINISDPAKNGTYEPYNGHQIDLNIPTLTGKLNGAGSSVVIFPDGLKKAGTVYDEIVGNKAIKRVGSVDLGNLTWYLDSTYGFYADVSGKLERSNNGLCSHYETVTYNSSFTSKDDVICVNMRSLGAVWGNRVVVRDSSYSDPAVFKTAMSGVTLYYELATPEEYILDNALQLQYPVVAGGTEMVLPTTGTAPMKMDVIYGNAADAAATMSQNFISVDSMKEFLAALGTQMGGTWSMGYENGKHTFTFTSN